jgi:ketosteroid isomerase-like protein
VGARENTALIEEYLARIGRRDPRFAELLADDVVWWVPPGSDAGGTYRGKPAVLEFIAKGAGKYASDPPLRFEIERIVADDEWACAQLVLQARTAAGRDYRNYLHIAFQIRDGRIALAREYVDTKLAHDAFGQP